MSLRTSKSDKTWASYDQNNIDLLVLTITHPVLIRFGRLRAHFKALV